jgi:hypothetical protein
MDIASCLSIIGTEKANPCNLYCRGDQEAVDEAERLICGVEQTWQNPSVPIRRHLKLSLTQTVGNGSSAPLMQRSSWGQNTALHQSQSGL